MSLGAASHTHHLHGEAGGTKPCPVTALCAQYLLYHGVGQGLGAQGFKPGGSASSYQV